MAAIGNLNDYVKLQLAESLKLPGGGGVAGLAAQFALGTQIARDLGTAAPPVIGASMASASASGAASGIPELLSPAEVAQSLGVSEADVLAALGDGSLKGKKIGSAWRITRVALDEFLKH
jgi:excisionase family DNA binding protein